jgi:hypothetical protein
MRGPASLFAADWWWDEDYYVATTHGRVMWECVRLTSGGDSVRLARLDNKQLRGFVRYVKPGTQMRLVEKNPKDGTKIHPCNCNSHNGGQCYNCLNGFHRGCDGKPKCKCRNARIVGLRIVAKTA